jgi:hypothetical protein
VALLPGRYSIPFLAAPVLKRRHTRYLLLALLARPLPGSRGLGRAALRGTGGWYYCSSSKAGDIARVAVAQEARRACFWSIVFVGCAVPCAPAAGKRAATDARAPCASWSWAEVTRIVRLVGL